MDVESQATTAETSGSDDGSADVAIGVANVFAEERTLGAANDFESRNAALTLSVPGMTVPRPPLVADWDPYMLPL